ncbi:mannose-6-phosphate isomerase, class I [Nocardioides rotundus]|uniref:mannose-6-phosphate isomerase, class I n=1 Tax=Nocardioides rotundus TaxID=1774216 RepID=UPI001CBCD0A0|nr:mannose-6-phosphate isomerase, class I [Nocardioides rotundus]UAL29177.1 mannose-6-phosphate isomerase, class I [Nocardioides rotundus]
MWRLTNPVRHYAWGSRSHLPRLLGVPDDGEPWAELWLGAHPSDPSTLPDGRGLDAAVAADPASLLGAEVAEHFEGLPFLMKLLAAAEPLSLQVHPDSAQAAAGYDAEDAAGVPVSAPARNYRDRSAKPELVLALTRFEGMAGWRTPERSAEILRMLGVPFLDEVAERLSVPSPPAEVLRDVVTYLLRLPQDDVPALVADVTAAAAAADARPHPISSRRRPAEVSRDDVSRESLRVFAQTAQLGKRYPEDAGVLVTLLLNHVVLARGEAMYLDAGVVHAYTSGFGLEVMANSDNVLRAGLTPKHVDVAELLEITSFEPSPAPLWEPAGDPERVEVFAPPVAQFRLSLAEGVYDDLPATGPRILLCLDGTVTVAAGGSTESLAPGGAVFLSAADGPVSVVGDGRVAVCSVPG